MTLLNHKSSFKLFKTSEVREDSKLVEFAYEGINKIGEAVSGKLFTMSRSEARYVLERDGFSSLNISNKKRLSLIHI